MKLKLLKSFALGKRGAVIDQKAAGLSDVDVARLIERQALVRTDAKGRVVEGNPSKRPAGSPAGRARPSSSSRADLPPINSASLRRRGG